MRLKEDVLRANAQLFGHRYLMDRIVPGGVACDLAASGAAAIGAECDVLEGEVRLLKASTTITPGCRTASSPAAGSPPIPRQLGVIGLAGRASSQAWDLRAQASHAPYDALDVRMATHKNGDVAARAILRFEEIFESLRLVRSILERIAAGRGQGARCLRFPPAGSGSAGWRAGAASRCSRWSRARTGCVRVATRTTLRGRTGRRSSSRCTTTSFRIFRLINKSFNLSYSGCDL